MITVQDLHEFHFGAGGSVVTGLCDGANRVSGPVHQKDGWRILNFYMPR